MRYLFLILSFFFSVKAIAQLNINELQKENVDFNRSSSEYIYFKPSINTSAKNLENKIYDILKLSSQYQFKQLRSTTDNQNNLHIRYAQYYKNYRVCHVELIAHDKNGVLKFINGIIPTKLNNTVEINVRENAALQTALLHFGAQKYSWQNDAKNNILQNSNTTLPKAELVWVQKDGAIDTYNYNSYILCYKFDIVSSIPFDAKSIFVNASSGKYEKYIQLMAHCNPVSVSTSFYGNRTISTQLLSGPTYRLANDCNTAKLYTVNWPFNTYFQKVGNTWLDDSLRAAATSLWGLEQTYSYFKNTHYYNSWDNQNGDIYSYENALFCNTANCTPNNPNNASFYRGTMKVGWGSSGLFDDWNSLDIIAHEFTHGISDTMAHLVYQNESGALNESFSDIFGNTVQLDVLGNVANVWQIGEDRTNFSGGSSAPIRDMANPNNYFDPDTYLGTYWQNFATNTNDLGGVHTNSGVQNYMYYLLAVGDNGTNDLGNYFAVEGIGITNARRIAFKALVDYFLPNSTHQDARTAWLSAAEDLFGIFSQEYKQVANAWYAVGVCSNSGNELLADCGTITAYSDKIFYGFKYIFLGLCGNQTINPASNIVSYKAGTIITLMPGFTATQGSNFRASIVDCVPQ